MPKILLFLLAFALASHGSLGDSLLRISPFRAPLYSLKKTETAPEKERVPTVLYVPNSEGIAFYYLGALYAFESYGVKIDTVIASGIPAWISALWKSGFSLDEIQVLLKSKEAEPFLKPAMALSPLHMEFPFGNLEFPTLALKIGVEGDSSRLKLKTLPLRNEAKKEVLFKLRVQESLSRGALSKEVYAVDCLGNRVQGREGILESFYFGDSLRDIGCVAPLPSFEHFENSIILTSLPIRGSARSRKNILLEQSIADYKNAGVLIRPHSISDYDSDSLTQLGFASVENNLKALREYGELTPYETKSKNLKPWFRFELSEENLRATLLPHIRSFGNEKDTGLAYLDTFYFKMAESPVYDSIDLSLNQDGQVQVTATSPLVAEFNAGGFGSSVHGAFFAYDARVRFVSQFEYEIGVNGFVGPQGLGVTPELKLLRLADGLMDFDLFYNFRMLKPLASYFNKSSEKLRIFKETTNEFSLAAIYRFSNSQTLTLEALFGEREYEMSERILDERVRIRRATPNLTYSRQSKNYSPWFSPSGYAFNASVGLESDAAPLELGESVPIYWKFSTSGSISVSPISFIALSLGYAAGANVYREDGEDFPPSFGFTPIDFSIRQAILASPWCSEWIFPELRSHEYALLRASFGLYKGPFSAWVFAAYIRDFENTGILNENRLLLEPALRFAYESLTLYFGFHQTLSAEDFRDFSKLSKYKFFIRVGNYAF